MTIPKLQNLALPEFGPRPDRPRCVGRKSKFLAAGLALCAAVGLAGTAHASIIAYDDFTTYTPGSISGQSGGTGFTGTWSVSAGGAIATGNSLELTPSGSTIKQANAFHTLAPNTAFPSDGSAVYAAIEFSIRSGGGTARLTDSGLNLGGGTLWMTGVSNMQFWGNGAPFTGTVAFDTTYRLVSRLTRNDAGNDTMLGWLNPTSETDPALFTGVDSYNQTASALSNFQLQAMEFFGSGPADTLIIERVAIGTTFNDVATVPEPTTGILLVGGLLGLVAGRRRRNV